MNKYKRYSKMLLLAVMLGSSVAVSASAVAGEGPMPVSLGEAGTFAILSQSGITDVYRSAIVGDVGTSPITGAALLLTCGEVSGTIYTVDAAGPLPCAVNDATFLGLAVGDMGFAYDDAAGRLFPDYSELGAGEIGGLTLAPGLYKWTSGLLITTDVTLSGGPDDVWIFQVAGTMNQANATRVTLAGGALSKNIFWQVAGAVTLGTNAHFEGIVLGKTMIAVNTGTSVNGRLFAQTAVTLQMNEITEPAECSSVPPPSAVAGEGPMPVSLGEAGTFAILSQSGITDVYRSAIVGDVGTSPITGAALLLTCGEVSGTIYTVDAAGPLPCAVNDATFLGLAVGDMGFAYDDAAGRLFPDYSELGAGEIGGLTLAPGLYKWTSGLLITTDVTLSGGPDDVWIFQVAGTMNQANATRVTLAGGALSKNIFWQVAGAVTLGTNAHFEGIVLGKTMIAVNTGTSVNGRLFAQTAVTLQMNAITEPAE